MTPSETTPEPPGAQPPTRWGWPVWERDEVLREQVALLRQNFPMTLLASLATALGTLWVMARVADTQATTVWLSTHALVIAGVYLTLRSISPFTDPAPGHAAGAKCHEGDPLLEAGAEAVERLQHRVRRIDGGAQRHYLVPERSATAATYEA